MKDHEEIQSYLEADDTISNWCYEAIRARMKRERQRRVGKNSA